MAIWDEAGKGRWVRSGDDLHLLLQSGTRFVEFHQGFVHAYDGPKTPDANNPLGEAVWVRTWERPGWADSTAEQIWQVMADIEYTKATAEPPPQVIPVAP